MMGAAWREVLCLALVGLVDWRSALGADPVRVMSFNIRYGTANDGVNHWDRRREFLRDTIRAFDPDLLGTQETLGFQRDWLREQLPGYGVLGVGRDDGQNAGEMMALYYREARFEKLAGGHFWLSETPEKAGSKSWDSSLPRMVTWVRLKDRQAPQARPVLFFNTHFDHRGNEARARSAALIRQRLREQGPQDSLIVTGDFNDGDGGEPHRQLFADLAGTPSPVVDTFRVKHPQPGPNEGTFTEFLEKNTGGPRIDWIAVSRDWEIESAAIDRTAREGLTPSDHFPVTATLRRAETTSETSTEAPAREAPDANPTGTPESDALPQASAPATATHLAGGPFEVLEERDITYYDGPGFDRKKHKLDLFLPKGQRNFPVLLFIHGGAWVSGDRRLYTSVGRVFAKNGVGTAVISYRLSPSVQHPAHIEDCARAFAWVRNHIGERGGRTDQIFVAGQSAGGHLTALLCTHEKYLAQQDCSLADIRGAIPISGIFEFRPGRYDRVIGEGPEAALSASPIRHLSDRCPPFLVLYAESDIPNCDQMSQRLCRELNQLKVPAESHEISGRNHVSIMFRLMMDTRDPATQQMLQFIARQGTLALQEVQR